MNEDTESVRRRSPATRRESEIQAVPQTGRWPLWIVRLGEEVNRTLCPDTCPGYPDRHTAPFRGCVRKLSAGLWRVMGTPAFATRQPVRALLRRGRVRSAPYPRWITAFSDHGCKQQKHHAEADDRSRRFDRANRCPLESYDLVRGVTGASGGGNRGRLHQRNGELLPSTVPHGDPDHIPWLHAGRWWRFDALGTVAVGLTGKRAAGRVKTDRGPPSNRQSGSNGCLHFIRRSASRESAFSLQEAHIAKKI